MVHCQQNPDPTFALYFDHIDRTALCARLHGTRHTGRSKLRWVDNIAADVSKLIGLTTVEATREALNRHQWRRYTRLALAVWACNLPTSASPWRSRIRKHKIAQFGLALRGSQILSRGASGLWHVQCTVQSALPPVTPVLSSVGRTVGPCRYLSRPCFYWRHVYCLHSHTNLINRFLFVYRNSIGILIMADLVIDKEAYLRRIRKLYSVWEVSCMEFGLSKGLVHLFRMASRSEFPVGKMRNCVMRNIR